MGRIISGVVIFTILGKILGFVRELLLSYFFGADGISDAYLISQTIPGTIFQFVGTGLTTCFIPAYYKVLKDHGRKECDIFTNKVLTMIFAFSTIVIGIIWAFTPTVVKIFAAGFSGETLKLAIVFTRIGVSSLYFSSVIYVYNSYLQANDIFTPTAAAAIPNSIVIICSIILGATWNVVALSVGSLLATAIQMAFLWFFVNKLGFSLKINFHWKDSYIRFFFSLMGPVILGVSVNEINILVDKSIASQLAVGGISALTYANSLVMLVQGGFAQPIATVFYPKITQKIAGGFYREAKEDLYLALNYLYLILLPMTVEFIILSPVIVKVFFGHGAFDEEAIELTSSALYFYAIGIVFVGMREMLARYYYAYGNTRIPMVNSIVGMLINIILNLTLSKEMGIGGLAMATSVSAFVTVSLMWCQCSKLSEEAVISLQWKEIGKIICSALLMAGILLFLEKIIPDREIGQLILLSGVGILSYVGIVFLFNVKCVRLLFRK